MISSFLATKTQQSSQYQFVSSQIASLSVKQYSSSFLTY